jgi:hypothetical protein
MIEKDFDDQKVRDEHFQESVGRPLISEIIADGREMLAAVAPDALPIDRFTSDDILIVIWSAYPKQHVYIGLILSRLVRELKLPIKRVGTQNKRAIYSIVL